MIEENKFCSDVVKKYFNKELCPSHYFSAPVLSWDVMLNIAKVELDQDVE